MASQNSPVSSAQNTPQETPKSLKKNVADFIGRTWKSSTHDLGSIKDRLKSSKEGLQSLYEKCCFRENHVENEEEQESLKSKIGSAFSKNLTKSSAKIASFSQNRIFPIFHKSRNSEEVVQNWIREITETLHSSDKERQIENLQRFIDRVCSPKGEKILIKEYKRSAGDLSSRTLLQNFACQVIEARARCNTRLDHRQKESVEHQSKEYLPLLLNSETKLQGSFDEKDLIRKCFGMDSAHVAPDNVQMKISLPVDHSFELLRGKTFIDGTNEAFINKDAMKKQIDRDLIGDQVSGNFMVNGELIAPSENEKYDFEFLANSLGFNQKSPDSKESEKLLLKAMLFFQQGASADSRNLATALISNLNSTDPQFVLTQDLVKTHDTMEGKNIAVSADKQTFHIEMFRFYLLKNISQGQDSDSSSKSIVRISYNVTLHSDKKIADGAKESFSSSAEFQKSSFFNANFEKSYQEMVDTYQKIEDDLLNQELLQDSNTKEILFNSLDLLLITMRSSYGRRLCAKLSPEKQKQFQAQQEKMLSLKNNRSNVVKMAQNGKPQAIPQKKSSISGIKKEFPKAFNQVKNYFSSLNKPKEKPTELS
ncbi:MAG: hypothetical protein QRY74_01730 [Chlamydia sp.]